MRVWSGTHWDSDVNEASERRCPTGSCTAALEEECHQEGVRALLSATTNGRQAGSEEILDRSPGLVRGNEEETARGTPRRDLASGWHPGSHLRRQKWSLVSVMLLRPVRFGQRTDLWVFHHVGYR